MFALAFYPLLLTLFLLPLPTSPIHLTFHLYSAKSQCFYQYFHHLTKYRFSLSPQHPSSYQVQQLYFPSMANISTPSSLALYQHFHDTPTYHQSVHIHKFASQQGIHGFCVKNLSPEGLNYHFFLESGIELMEMENLPAENDTQVLGAELTLLEGQAKTVLESLVAIESAKGVTEEVFGLMSGRTAFFGVVGMVVVGVVNLAFYGVVKKALKDKKRI